MSDKLTYKDEHGVTRIGKFLRDAAAAGKVVAPAILDFAAKASGIDEFSSLADSIRGNRQINAQDKEVALKLIEKDMADAREETQRIVAKYDNETAREKEITKRWKLDSNSDSWLSKNTRPLITWVVVICYLTSFILDSVDAVRFSIPESHFAIITTILFTTLGGYFALRTVEKYNIKNVTKRNS